MMSTTTATIIALALAGQTPAANGSTYLLLGLLAVAAFVLALLLPKNRTLNRSITELRGQLENIKTEHKALRESERELGKKLDERLEQLDKAKRDLKKQRDKVHKAQQDAKELRDELKDKKKAYEKAKSGRTAFAEKDAPKTPAPIERPSTERAPPEVKGVTVAQLQEQLEALQAERDTLARRLEEERDKEKTDQGELKQMRRQVENFRRVDVVSKGKLEALQDQLKQLGRQYYDAVSEVAVLKGEVKPVPPSVTPAGEGAATAGDDVPPQQKAGPADAAQEKPKQKRRARRKKPKTREASEDGNGTENATGDASADAAPTEEAAASPEADSGAHTDETSEPAPPAESLDEKIEADAAAS